MKSALILPTVHINGTGPATLIANYTEARLALETAVKLLSETHDNRDYYPQGVKVQSASTQQFFARIGAVRRIINDLAAMESHVAHYNDDKSDGSDGEYASNPGREDFCRGT